MHNLILLAKFLYPTTNFIHTYAQKASIFLPGKNEKLNSERKRLPNTHVMNPKHSISLFIFKFVYGSTKAIHRITKNRGTREEVPEPVKIGAFRERFAASVSRLPACVWLLLYLFVLMLSTICDRLFDSTFFGRHHDYGKANLI